ncbi:MAG: TonB-dependent receptor [Prevotellaceae bacterium]|jgi:TonB-linked SusC/RagA family outer membrane protein|nr:TonB-dependent receptor [Prevotellaceae bacterium]
MKKRLSIIIVTFFAFAQFIAAQSITVTGRVVDADDSSGLTGVSIIVKSTKNGTITDIDGRYSITANQGDVLVFSYVGYKSYERTVNSSVIDVNLEPDQTVLDEVVAVGYGTMKRKDITGAISSVRAEDLKKTPAANIDQALSGRAAGVTVNANSGRPGASADIKVRGIGSANGSTAPIFIVDGMRVSDISFLSPNDIESTDILKDASSQAIYGADGANGVIVITTKKGQTGKSNISINSSISLQNRYRKLDVLNKADYLKVMLSMDDVPKTEKDFFKNNGFSQWLKVYSMTPASYYPINFDYEAQETDWQDEIFVKNALTHNHNISIDGATDKLNYVMSANYFDQTGVIIGSFYKRFTIRLNTSYQVRKWLKIGENFSFTHSRSRAFMGDNQASGGASVINGALSMAPWDPTHYPKDTYNNKGEDISGNPAAVTINDKSDIRNPFVLLEHSHPMGYSERWVGDVFLEITPIKGLTLRSDLAMDLSNNDDRSFQESYEFSNADVVPTNSVSHSQSRYRTLDLTNTITYAREIGKHNFSIMVGNSINEWRYDGVNTSGQNILNPIPNNWYVTEATQFLNKQSDGVDRTRKISYLGRAFYSYGDKYMATVNFRADGSSAFNFHPWGTFPSFSLGWRINEEKFMKDVKAVSNLKLRFGYGRTGNARVGGIGLTEVGFDTYSFYSYPLGTRYDVNYNDFTITDQIITRGGAVISWANTNISWETNEQYNIGIDFGFLKNTLTGTVELYQRNTIDALMAKEGTAIVGSMYAAQDNVGLISNKGIELTLEYRGKKGDFNYILNGNLSIVRNRFEALNGGNPIIESFRWTAPGLPVGSMFGYEYEGVYKTNEEAWAAFPGYYNAGGVDADSDGFDDIDANKDGVVDGSEHNMANQFVAGDAKYADLDGDGKFTEDDRTFIGHNFPKLTYGFNASFEWKGIDLQLFFQGVYGNKIYNAQRLQLEGTGRHFALGSQMTDVYRAEFYKGSTDPNPDANVDGSIPNPYHSVNGSVSTRFIEDGSYLRLKNLQLGYSLPTKLISKAKISRLRFYVQATNLFTITKYTGFDPEVGGGVDYGNYPQCRTFTFGMNFDF